MSESPREQSTPTIERRQEWYQVLYNLSAQRSHQVVAKESRDYKLLMLAAKDATLLVNRAAATLLDLGVVQTDGPTSSVPKGARTLARFLQDIVEPSGVVLLAGILGTLYGDRDSDSVHPLAALDRRRLERATRPLVINPPGSHERYLSPGELIDYVMQWHAPSYRIRYNLACYFADETKKQREALEQLAAALAGAPTPREAARLAGWSLKDPTLKPLRDRDRAGFDAVVDPWRPPDLPGRHRFPAPPAKPAA
jgi:hypothetical protein